MLLMAKADETHAFGLSESREVGDGNPDEAEDRIDVVQLQRVDDEMETVGQLRRLNFGGFLCSCLEYVCHLSPPEGRLCW